MRLFFLVCLLLTGLQAISQVKVGTNTSSVDPSAAFEVESTSGGLLPPRMSSAQRDLIANPAIGLMIVNTDFNCVEYYRGSLGGWFSMCPTLANVTTNSITAVTGTTATCGGSVATDGGATVTARGVCWNTSPNPTTDDNLTNNGIGIGSFISNLTGLSQGTSYYVRAYASNSAGVAYGNEVSFTTPDIPTVTTAAASSINGSSATSGGNVTNDGGDPVTARGVCWSTSPSPTTADNLTNNGTGTGSFSSLLGGLAYSTAHYARAYATNSLGTSYGEEISFTTTTGTIVSFTSTGSTVWTVPAGVSSAEVMVVAGGGAGGGQGNSDGSGGGGAGGLVYQSSYLLTPGASVPVTVGAGGAGVSAATAGNDGQNSIFGTITAIGGGGGGSEASPVIHRNGRDGGSGGGAGGYSSAYVGGTGTTGQGNNGGSNIDASPNKGGGGGGGAGSPGLDGGLGVNGHASGGNGLQYSISGTPTYYAGGGGDGGGYAGYGGNGGLGGGGKGGSSVSGQAAGTSGTANTGGGGGGTGGSSIGGTANSGAGGSGIVILRY